MKRLLNFNFAIVILLTLNTIVMGGILFSLHSLPYNVLSTIGSLSKANHQTTEMIDKSNSNRIYNIEEKIDLPFNAYQQAVYACDGEKRADRQCLPGYQQACVHKVDCRCDDGWEVRAGPADGCVAWKGAYIPENVEGYAFAGECEQICHLTGRAQ